MPVIRDRRTGIQYCLIAALIIIGLFFVLHTVFSWHLIALSPTSAVFFRYVLAARNPQTAQHFPSPDDADPLAPVLAQVQHASLAYAERSVSEYLRSHNRLASGHFP